MERVERPRTNETTVYDNHARRLIAHMKESRRLLDSFSLSNDTEERRSLIQPGQNH